MIIGFTICSNNYLAQAKIVADSFLKYHRDADFQIFLVDHLSSIIDYNKFSSANIRLVNEVIPELEMLKLAEKYNITELNTAVKPDIFISLFNQFPNSKIIYLDPDIEVFERFEDLLIKLDTYAMVLTPHILKPIDDGKAPADRGLLPTGIFNLGFLALANPVVLNEFLPWWRDRVLKYGQRDERKGFFYDQVWMNYVPVLFDFYYILKHPGYNMANWNLHERILEPNGSGFKVNGLYPLCFYHYSGYRYHSPTKISSYHDRFDLDSRMDIAPLFRNYQRQMKENSHETLNRIPCYYVTYREKVMRERHKNRNKGIKSLLYSLRFRLAHLIKPKPIYEA